MESIFNGIDKFGPAGLLLQAILVSLLGIFLLVGFIVLRRWYRARYFRRRNQRTAALRSQWEEILSGTIAAKDWRFNTLDFDIVESFLLDSIEMSSADKLKSSQECLRVSGLLDIGAEHYAMPVQGDSRFGQQIAQQTHARAAVGFADGRAALVLAEAANKELAYRYIDIKDYPGLDSDSCDAVLLAMMGRHAGMVFSGRHELVPAKPLITLCTTEARVKVVQRKNAKTGETTATRNEKPRAILHNPATWTLMSPPIEIKVGISDARTTGNAIPSTIIL